MNRGIEHVTKALKEFCARHNVSRPVEATSRSSAAMLDWCETLAKYREAILQVKENQ